MSVFKTFFKITRSNIKVLLIYFAVSITMSILLSRFGTTEVAIFTQEKINVAVIDNDDSEVSRALAKYVELSQNLVEVDRDIDSLQNALYFNTVDYLIVVPEGFGESTVGDGNVKLQVTTAPNSFKGIYEDMQIEQFVTNYKCYMLLGLDADETFEKTIDNLSIDTKTDTLIDDNTADERPAYYSFFLYMAYGFIAVILHAIGSIMVAFNKEEIEKRMNCSSLPLAKKNLFMILGNLIVTLIVWGIYNVICLAFNRDALLADGMYPYYLLNSFVFALVCLALGYLVGILSKDDGHIAIFSVSFSMVFSFLGGIFVSIDFLSEGVKAVARFLPTYWYVGNLTKLSNNTLMTETLRQEFGKGIGIQLIFAVAVLAVAFMLSRNNAKGSKAH